MRADRRPTSSISGRVTLWVLRLVRIMLSGVLVVLVILAGLLLLVVTANTALRDLEFTMRATEERE